MKVKFLSCVWCGGDIAGESPQYRQKTKKAKKPLTMYCSSKCRYEARFGKKI